MPYVIDVRTYKGLYFEGTQGIDERIKESEAHFSYHEAVERLDALRKGGKKARQRKRVIATAEPEEETEGGLGMAVPRRKEITEEEEIREGLMMEVEEGVEWREKGKEDMSVGSPWGEEGYMISSDSVVL